MARKTSGIPTAGSPPVTDDFSLIKGIGPVLSQRLHEAGISTYSQLASLSPVQLSEMVGGLSAKKIARQNWAGQAEKLAPKKILSRPQPKEAPKRTLHQHYENFTIEFLIDEKKTTRRTRVVHIQSGDAETWAGWEADQLTDFLARHTGIRFPAKKLQKKESLPVPIPYPDNAQSEPVHAIVKIAEPMTQLSNIPVGSQAVPEVILPVLHPPNNSGLAGTLKLQDFCILPIGVNSPARSLHPGQPCQARVTLDLTEVTAPSDILLKYKATITFKQLGGGSYPMAEENNLLERSGCVALNFACTTPPPGIYRPEALVLVFSNKTAPGLMASLKGELIQVI